MTSATVHKSLGTTEARELIDKQRAFFQSGKTRDVAFRMEMLQALKDSIKRHESDIAEATFADFRKSEFETYVTESGLVMEEIGYTLKFLQEWASPVTVDTPLAIQPGKSYIHSVPYGVAMIIGAWNYPFQLTVMPIIGALAAGNTAILKPSELAPHTSACIKKIMAETFPEEYVAVVEGGPENTQAILAHPLDYIFFTGSTRVGKIVAKAAAEHLTPNTLELGGKSPCIVHEDAQLGYAAKRIAWGKFLNAGQTCVAPDFLAVHHTVKEELIDRMKQYIRSFYGVNPKESPDYPRIISEKHLQRLVSFLEDGTIVAGGQYDLKERYLAPTLLDNIHWNDAIMGEEIFGPILPIITYDDLDQLFETLQQRPHPLAAYFFSERNKHHQKFIHELDFGGGCINDSVAHLANPNLPFGGKGSSGSGAYHGKFSFDTFSHQKAIHKKTTWVDVPLRYPPYEGKIGLIKQIIK